MAAVIFLGFMRPQDWKRRASRPLCHRLDAWLDEALIPRFEARVLPVDTGVDFEVLGIRMVNPWKKAAD
jgi:hypothetical protein